MTINRIGAKLVLAVVGILAVQVAVHGYLEYRDTAGLLRQEFLRRGQLHALGLARAAEYGILTRDREELTRVAETAWPPDDVDLVYVAFYDENGDLIASRRWGGQDRDIPAHDEPAREFRVGGAEHAGSQDYRFHAPVQVSRKVVGDAASPLSDPAPPGAGEYAMAVTCRSTHALMEQIAAQQGRMLVVSAAIFAAAAVFLSVFAYRLVRPIRTLVVGTERLASGDFTTRVNVGRRHDELQTLADSFNRMTAQLHEQRREIVSYSQDLENKVVARTAELAEANTRLQAANGQLEELATTDELTGLWNRRRFIEMLDRECRRAERTGTHLALAMLDVDRFKAVNDTFGHAFGDRVLKAVAGAIQNQARSTDIVARYGGEEFMVLMADTSAEEAVGAAERIREHIARRPVTDGKHTVEVTVSVGISALGAGGAGSPDSLVRLADESLYAAKQAGRNCTKTWNEISRDQQEAILTQAPEVVELERRMATLSLQAKDVFVQSIQGLVQAMDARDPHMRSHSRNVTVYAVGIAETMGLEPDEVAIVRRAARVHDIGKIGVPDAILRKPAPLDDGERRLMEQHVLVGVRILEQMRFLEREVPIVRHHHERWDGKGYPDGLAGLAIPPGARVLAVADAFDALTSERPYRAAADLPEALRTLIEESGRQFDAEVVDGLMGWVRATGRQLGRPADVTTDDVLRRGAQAVMSE